MTDYEKYPNLMRVAKEIAKFEHPYRTANALLAILAAVADDTPGQDAAAKWDKLAQLTPEDIRKGATR